MRVINYIKLVLVVLVFFSGRAYAEHQWTIDVESNPYSFIFVDDILIPIPIKQQNGMFILNHKDRGHFKISDGMIRSSTRTPAIRGIKPDPSTVTYSKRPTLFISIQGFSLEGSIDLWQRQLQESLSVLSVTNDPLYSQFMHMSVDWDSDEILKNQVDDLAGTVNHFLDGRSYPWDVVVIGYSRGGIFAHDLADKILPNSNLNALHSILLDPTAAAVFNDFYPQYKHDYVNKHHYASLFYDGQEFFYPTPLPIAIINTDSDRDINGYSNYGLFDFLRIYPGSDHSTFAEYWTADVQSGFLSILNRIWDTKETATFIQDGDISFGWDIVRIKEDPIIIDANIEFYNGNVYIDGVLVVGVAHAAISGMVGQDGLDITTSIVGATARAVINEDGATVAANTLIATTIANISLEGVNAEIGVLGQNADISIDYLGFAASASLLGLDSSLSVSLTDGVSANLGPINVSISF